MKYLPVLGAIYLALAPGNSATAHSWYPLRCCSDTDCAPVVRTEPAPGGKWVTSQHGTVFVPSTFAAEVSQDNDAHVCMRPDTRTPGKMMMLCYFEPGSF